MFELATAETGIILLDQRGIAGSALSIPLVGKEGLGLTGVEGQRRPSIGQARRKQRGKRERRERFERAAHFAFDIDCPLNVGLTITWTALQTAGERAEGHCLWRGKWDRERYTRDELARLCRSEGVTFAALWGRDVGADMGPHVHLSMYWPSNKLAKLVAVIERISGSSAEFMRKPYTADVVARSVCGGWQIDMNNRKDDRASALEWVEYIATQDDKHAVPPEIMGKAFGISQAIGNAAQIRHRQKVSKNG